MDAVVRPVRAETHVPEDPRIEEGDLYVVPVLAVDRAVPLQAVVEEFGFPADFVVGEIVGGV